MRTTRKKRKNSIKKFDNKKIFICFIIFILILLSIVIVQNLKRSNDLSISSVNDANIIQTDTYIQNNSVENSNSSEDEIQNTPVSFTLTVLGDALCHNTQYMDAYNKNTGEYDFSYVFDDILYYTKTSDITIGSLETTFAGEDKGYSNYPTFNSPDNFAYSLKKIGIDILTTAGNHALDYGYSGLSRTIDVLDNAGFYHLGTYKTAEEQEKILIQNIKGVKIAFLNYTYGTNGIPVPSDKPYCVNLINKNLIKKQIEQAQNEEVDLIIACMHWGTEYRTTANSEQEKLADFLFTNGVDVILGNHPHVLEPMEKRTITLEDGTVKDVFVVYSLGNFTGDQRDEITRDSAILNLKFTKQTNGKVSFDSVDYVPIYMYKNSNVSSKKFKVLDIEKTIAKYENGDTSIVSPNIYKNLKIQLEKIYDILGDEIN